MKSTSISLHNVMSNTAYIVLKNKNKVFQFSSLLLVAIISISPNSHPHEKFLDVPTAASRALAKAMQ